MRSSWSRTRIQLENRSGRDATYCSTVCAGSGGQIRVGWDGTSLVRWNHDPARLEAQLRLTGGAAMWRPVACAGRADSGPGWTGHDLDAVQPATKERE
jgi:hypothetical protein